MRAEVSIVVSKVRPDCPDPEGVMPDPVRREGWFFIVGCQRSGTTLMRLVLESHPDIACLDETTSYDVLADTIEAPVSAKLRRGFKVPRWTEQLGRDVAWDFGLPVEARHLYRGEPIVFLIRDVRDTVASMISLDLGRSSWLDAWGRPILEDKIARDPGFADRFAPEIARLRASGDDPASVGALYWLYKNRCVLDYRARGWPIVPVRYEALAADPEPSLSRIVEALGLPWDSGLLAHPSRPHSEVFADGRTVGGTDPSRPIDDASVGRWRSVLSDAQERAILEMVGDLPARIDEGLASPG